MPKKLALYLLLLTLVPFSASAAGLGKIKVKSGLGEPFEAEIEVLENTADQALPLKAGVGSTEEYASSGLADTYIPQGIHIQVIRHADNSRVLRLVSDRPVNEPFLELLVKAESSNTNILRQYTILLDPPVSRFNDEPENPRTVEKSGAVATARQNAKAASAGAVQPDDAIPEFVPRKSRKSSSKKTKKQAVTAYDAEAGSLPAAPVDMNAETYTTQSGDVFGKVAQRYQPEGISLKKVMAAFFAANPDAFVDGDINQLKAGQTLRIPTQETMKGSTSKARPEETRKPEKEPVMADSHPQAAKEASPKFVLKISPGDADAGASDKQGGEPAGQPDPNQASANANGTPATSSTQPPPEQLPPADANVGDAGTESSAITPQPVPPPAAQAVPEKLISAPVSVEEKSMLDSILANLPWIAFGMAIPLLCFLVMYVMHRKRLADLHNLQEYDDEDGEAVDDARVPDADNGRPNGLGETLAYESATDNTPVLVGNVSQLFSTPQVRHDAEMDIHEVDPLVEAEIYMSYGRDEQAESILRNALVKTPHKHELSLGLLKIYADRSDTQSFERVARTVHEAAELGALEDVVLWGKAAILGLKIDPLNPLYQIEAVSLDNNKSQGNPLMSDAPLNDVPAPQEAPAEYPVEDAVMQEVEFIDLPELPPLEVGEIVSPARQPLPELELPEDLEALKIEQDVAATQSSGKSNVLEFTLDDFMRPPIDDAYPVEPGYAIDADAELFPTKKTPHKK